MAIFSLNKDLPCIQIFPRPSVWWHRIILPISSTSCFLNTFINSTLSCSEKNCSKLVERNAPTTPWCGRINPAQNLPGQCRHPPSRTTIEPPQEARLLGGHGGWVVEGVSTKSGTNETQRLKQMMYMSRWGMTVVVCVGWNDNNHVTSTNHINWWESKFIIMLVFG